MRAVAGLTASRPPRIRNTAVFLPALLHLATLADTDAGADHPERSRRDRPAHHRSDLARNHSLGGTNYAMPRFGIIPFCGGVCRSTEGDQKGQYRSRQRKFKLHGRSLGCELLIEDLLKSRSLVTLLDAYVPSPIPVNVIYPSQRQVPLKLRTFLDFAVPRLRKRLGYENT
jgi:DNA-binding transcriptional LysR family regulator